MLAAGKIPEPHDADNETGLLPLGGEDWIYTRDFEVSAKFLDEESVFLNCESLDTMAAIFINGHKVAATENMFLRHRVEVKNFLRTGTNQIRIELASAEKSGADR